MTTDALDFLAVDLGASSGRVLRAGLHGERLELEELHRFANEPVAVLGDLCWDPLRLWGEIRSGLRRYGERAGGGRRLAGVSVDAWGVDFALLDERGRLLGAPHHYRDSRTDGVPARVFARVPRERIYRATGIQFMQINTLFQLYRMVEDDDPRLRAAATLLWMPDLFHHWLGGRPASDTTIASTSQLLAASGDRWAEELLRELQLPREKLPELVPPATPLGELRPELASAEGLTPGVPVIASAGHDTAAAVAALDGLGEGAFISSGTWSLVGVERPGPVLDERALALNFTNEGGVAGTVRLLKNVAGLWLLQECRRQWRREGVELSWEELLEAARDAEPFRAFVDPGAETFLAPGDMPAALRRACRASGQPEPDTPGRVARCCLESLALKYREVLLDLEELDGRRLQRIRVVGGGSRNRLLNRFTADACERPVIAGPVEATALGNAMLQAVAVGALPSVAAGRDLVARSVTLERFEPSADPATRAGWREAGARFADLVRPAPDTPGDA